MFVDIIAHHCTLYDRDRPKDESIAKFFDLHPEFSIHITDDLAEFMDSGHVFFSCYYHYYLRKEGYLHISGPDPIRVAINVPEEHVTQNSGSLKPGDYVMRTWSYSIDEEDDDDDEDDDD